MKYNKYGINKNTDDLFNEISQKNIDSKLNFNMINTKLNYYTLYRDKKIIPPNIKTLISNIVYKDGINYYLSDDICFGFLLLSDYVQNKKEKKILTSQKRYHKCHEESYRLTLGAPYKQSYILTGYINVDGNDILHSVAQVQDDKEEKIIDFTLNIVMSKEDYITITNFREFSKISRDKLRQDEEKIKNFSMGIQYYLFFHNELMKDLEKNEKLLKLK